jgi:hypothetical protein
MEPPWLLLPPVIAGGTVFEVLLSGLFATLSGCKIGVVAAMLFGLLMSCECGLRLVLARGTETTKELIP